MCYDDDARPPELPVAGSSARGEELVLTSSDGTRFLAYAAHPAEPAEAPAQVVIYPDVRGLHPFYKELALRFAESGLEAVAIDYFGRTAGLGPRDESFEYALHAQQVQVDQVIGDLQAALASLRSNAGANRPTFVVGFCRGGALALVSATRELDLAGVVAFYAGLGRGLGSGGTVLQQAPQIRYPVLGLFGGADPGIPPEQVAALDQALDTAGVEHTIVSYADAPHSFFDRQATEYAQAAANAWARVLSFIAAHSPAAG